MSEKTPVGKGPQHPFGEAWLDSCFQQTLLPGAPWHKLEADVAKELSERVKKQFSRPQRKQMLLYILGPNFVDSYFPLEVPQPHILEPPQMSGEERRRLGIEAQSWLLSQAYKCVQDMGYPSVGTGPTDGETSSKELSEFLQHTFSLFSNGLDRELYFLDEDLIKEKKDEIQLLRRRQKVSRVVVPSVIKSSPGGRSTADKPSTGQIKDKIHRLEGDPPPLWGPQSDRIGKSLVHVLQQDPKRFDTVVSRLHGRQLPASLRSYIWADVLFRSERKRMKGVNVEKLVRERFAKAVQKGIGDLGIKRATNSPITGLIENTVIETYSRTVGMLRHNEDGHLHEAARVLNVLYVYDRSYEPYVVHWLFPLQLALGDNQHLKGENIYELAMYLDLLNTSCFPTWPQVFATAERVMDSLQREDSELHKHLRHIAFINIQFDPKEFMVQLMHQEKARAEELLSVSPSAIQTDPMSAKLLADPLIFLRKWIGEGFVSVLDTPAILYVWDQCFMQGWCLDVLHNFCLVLLQLLRSRFMEAEDYGQMKEVFLGEPCKLYTMDIQVGWVHLEGGGALADIPPMNRQRPNIPVPGERSVPSTASTHHLQPCGLKYLRLKLVFPPESFSKEPMLSEYSVSDLKLHVSVYFGSVRLETLHSSHCPLEVSSETDGYGQRTLYVKFAEDKFEFASLDVENLDVERELGGALCAVVEVDYAPTEGDRANASTILGWSRVPLYQQVSSNQWNLQPGSNTFPLHPGMDSTSSPFPGTSAQFDTELLGYESELSLVVYELNNEPFEDPGDLIPVQQPPADTREQATPPKPTTEPPSPQRERTPLIVPTPEDLSKKRPKDIIPPPDTPGPEDPSPWVAHRTKAASWNPEPSGPTEAFDIYVDSLRFIPDNASIVKVTGRVVNTGDITAPPDIKALPELSSRARCPVLRYKLTVNEQGESASGDMVVMLRLYTVDMVTEKLTIVGTCFLQVFDTNNEGQHQLRVGGHQLRLHSGMPPLEKAQVIKASDMEAMPPIPGCSILVRLMPHSENFVPVPLYGKGYYQSLACRPSQSEDRVFSSYAQFMAYPADCRQMIKRVQALESVPPMLDDVSLVQWMDGRLDQSRQIPQGTTAGHINILQCVRYRVKQGLMVKVNQAFGLEGNNYVQCLMRVVPGSLAIDMEATEEGYGGKEQWLTLKHDYSSQLRAPQWLDKPQEIHPFYDEHSCVFVQLIGLAVEYRPTKDHSAPGKLTGHQGMHLSRLPDSSLVGWAIIPLFRGNAVLTGEHQVPLFSGRPSAELLGDLTLTSPERVIEKHQLNKSANRMFPGSLSVTIWDSHFDFKDIPVMRTYTSQLASAGNRDLYLKEHKGGAGKTIANLVNDNMKGFEKTGPVFEKEKEFFEQLVTKTYYELVEDALLLAGFGPLKTDHPGLRGLSEPQANIDQSNIAASTPPHQGDSPAAFD